MIYEFPFSSFVYFRDRLCSRIEFEEIGSNRRRYERKMRKNNSKGSNLSINTFLKFDENRIVILTKSVAGPHLKNLLGGKKLKIITGREFRGIGNFFLPSPWSKNTRRGGGERGKPTCQPSLPSRPHVGVFFSLRLYLVSSFGSRQIATVASPRKLRVQ